jgi:hypothetical protein
MAFSAACFSAGQLIPTAEYVEQRRRRPVPVTQTQVRHIATQQLQASRLVYVRRNR